MHRSTLIIDRTGNRPRSMSYACTGSDGHSSFDVHAVPSLAQLGDQLQLQRARAALVQISIECSRAIACNGTTWTADGI